MPRRPGSPERRGRRSRVAAGTPPARRKLHIGVGLRVSGDRPAGVQLAVCIAPHLRRELHAAKRRARRRFARLGAAPGRRPVIAEIDIGERDMLSVVLPADVLGARRALALLGGGKALRGLGGRA